MAGETVNRRLVSAFADVLDYPRARLDEAASACEELAADESPEAAALLARFRAFVGASTLGELQEAYTGAFDLDTMSDLDPTCYPYVGHHLFDENHKRSAFLVGLNERFRAHGFSAGNDLPDHLVVLLRFLAACDDEALVLELVEDAVLPALERMAGKWEGPADPRTGRECYRQVLRALLHSLRAGGPAGDDGAAEAAGAGLAIGSNGRE